MECKNIAIKQIIGDPIHGYIPLTELEYNLLQLPVMNRLHYVNQTAMAYLVFPGSVTTRFTHVVGATHLGGKIITQLLSTIENDADFKKLFPSVPSPEFIVKAVRLACLFHDVGHGPFSHAAEDAMLAVTKERHNDEVEEAVRLFGGSAESIPIHEFFSHKLIMNGEISDTIIKFEDKNLRDMVAELLVKSETGAFAKSNELGFHLIRNVVSSQLDADRLDYLLRDSMMSGVKFGLIDVDRIIRNMTIFKMSGDKFKLAIHERAIGNIEDMLDARYKMYRYFYNHHTVVVLNELIKTAIDMMVEDDPDVAKQFHWTSYKDGNSTDEFILSKLREKMSDGKYEKVRGLLDRRYLPLSFFKSNPDFARLIVGVVEASGKKEEMSVVRENIIKFFKESDGAKKIQVRLDQDDALKECNMLHTDLRMKPYIPFDKNDKVWLCRSDEEELCELSSESPYFKEVNRIWGEYHGLFVFYLFPGKQRSEFRDHRGKIREIMAEEIAKFYSAS